MPVARHAGQVAMLNGLAITIGQIRRQLKSALPVTPTAEPCGHQRVRP